MQPPVRSLDELMAATQSIYDPQRQAINQQINQTSSQLPQLEQGLFAAKDRAFKDISQLASNKGMLFSGFAPEQQARYTGEKFLPALTGLRSKVQDNIGRLQSALLGLDTEQRKGAMTTREGDLSQLYNWNQEQDRRKWEAEQKKIGYEQELQKLREAARLRAADSAPATPGTDIINYYRDKLKGAGPLESSNQNVSRQKQDQWVYEWFLNNGILDPGAQTQVWNLINSTFNRSEDPTKDWLYAR